MKNWFLCGAVLWACTFVACDPPAEGGDAGSPKTGNEEQLHDQKFEQLVASYEDSSRNAWQKPEQVIALLGPLKGKTVADIGAGSGYFTFALLPLADTVVAIDIDKRFLDYIARKNRDRKNDTLKLKTRLGQADTPGLMPNEADAVLVVNTYHHIEARTEYFREVWKGMKKGGLLLVVDFKKGELPMGPDDKMKLPLSQMQRELTEAGFVLKKTDPISLPYQHVLLMQK